MPSIFKKKEPTGDETRLKSARECFTKAKENRKGREWLWYLMLQFRNGNHYLKYYENSNKVGFTVDNKQRNNILQEADRICTMIEGQLTAVKPLPMVVPRNKYNEKSGAELKAKSIEYGKMASFLYDLTNAERVNDEMAYDLTTFGTFFTKVGFDHGDYYLNDKGEKIYDGNPTLERYSPFSVYWDTDARTLAEGRFVDLVLPKNVDWLNRRFPGHDIKPDNLKSSSSFEKAFLNSKFGGTDASTKNTALLHETWEKEYYTADVDKETEKLDEEGKIVLDEAGDPVMEPLLGEDGEPIVRKIPKYRLWCTYWLDDVTKPLAVMEDPYGDGVFPIVEGQHYIQPGQVDGKGELEDIMTINQQADRVFNKLIENARRNGSKVFVKKGSKVSADSLNSDEFSVIHYRDVAPSFESARPLPDSYFQFIDWLVKKMEDKASAHEALMGSAPAGVTAGKAIEALRQGDVVANQPKVRRLAKGWEAIWEKLFHRISHLWTVEHVGDICGTDNDIETISINPQDVDVSAVHVVLAPKFAYTPLAQIEMILDLATKGFLDPKTVLEELAIGNVEEIISRRDKAIKEGTMPSGGGEGGIDYSAVEKAGAGGAPPSMPAVPEGRDPMQELKQMSQEFGP